MGKIKRYTKTLYIDIDEQTYNSISMIAERIGRPIADVCRTIIKSIIPPLTNEYMNSLLTAESIGPAFTKINQPSSIADNTLPIPIQIYSLLIVKRVIEGDEKCT